MQSSDEPRGLGFIRVGVSREDDAQRLKRKLSAEVTVSCNETVRI